MFGPVLPLSDHKVLIGGNFPVYAVMAEPLQKGAPSFYLTLFSSSEHCALLCVQAK